MLSKKNRSNSFFKHLNRFRYINCTIAIDCSDNQISTLKRFALQVVQSIMLPPYRTSDLRACGHRFPLPDCATDLYKR